MHIYLNVEFAMWYNKKKDILGKGSQSNTYDVSYLLMGVFFAVTHTTKLLSA